MTLRFPDGFLWGTASSSHQVEGGEDGSDWAAWERARGLDRGRACGWWAGRAEEDLAAAAGLGQNAHRMSLEWGRLEPEEGTFSDQAFARYGEILAAAARHGLTMMVTVSHFTLPRWLAARGGWAANAAPGLFARYAAECARRLGSRVSLWATLNEPSVLSLMGYVRGDWPPGRGGVALAYRALANQLRGHADARAAMKETGARVGLVINAPLLDPADPASMADRAAAGAQDWMFTGAVLHALRTGLFVPPMVSPRSRVPGLEGGVDFLGLNYYGRYAVRFPGRHVHEPSVRTERNDWGQIAPSGLARQLLRLWDLRVPLYVTENGVMDAADALRPRYLVDHVAAVGEAIRLGADVRGYFHWTLVDNFEWAEAWNPSFGLFALDRVTQRRTARPSAAVFEGICRANAL